jgi:hypothetical protein
VKLVRSSVWPTQIHIFSLASDHDVSSMWADGAATIAAATSAATGSKISPARRSSLEIMPSETSSPIRSEAVTVHESRLISEQKGVEPRKYLSGASVRRHRSD